MSEAYISLVKMLLPEGILEYFELMNVSDSRGRLEIYLEEKNLPPQEYKDQKLLSKGFHAEISIQDFPIRGRKVYLLVKRRRWEVVSTGKIIDRDWNLVIKGTRMTTEFGLFLKGIYG